MTSKPETLSRTILPIPDRPFTGPMMFDAKDPNSKFPKIEPLRPPKGAPNVLLVLLDDAGFAAMNTFGGPCTTPTADRLAAGGLTYTRFHVCALCAPTRQALLTGRNHHAGWDGLRSPVRDFRTGAQLDSAKNDRAVGGDPEVERLLDRPNGQVPRSTILAERARWDPLMRGPRAAASSISMVSLARRRTTTGRTCTRAPPRSTRPTPEEGYHRERRHRHPHDRMGAAAEGADAGQAVLCLLRARRHARSSRRAHGVV